MSQINSFSGKYRFLSNFWPCKVVWEGVEYSSTEHAYQAAKLANTEHRELVRNAKTPGQAKKLGRKFPMIDSWDNVKLNVMYDLCLQKFQNPELKQKLLDTGDAILIEGNTWNDTFWGICNGVGENNLGKILMRIRSEINVD